MKNYRCSGGTDGISCGVKWYMNETWDGENGVGEQMSALSVFLSTTIGKQPIPVTSSSGGTSRSDPTAGNSSSDGDIDNPFLSPTYQKDRAGAGIITAVICATIVFACYFLMSSSFESGGPGPKIKDKRMSAFGLPIHNRKLRKGKGKGKEKELQPEVLDLGSGRGGSSGILQDIDEKPVEPKPIYQGGTMAT